MDERHPTTRPDECTPPGTSRRWFLRSAAATGAIGVAGVASAQSDPERIELDGDTAGWLGRAPESIADETNPTLPLEAGTAYVLEWENVDGVPHNVAIYDEDESAIVRTETMSEEGATQSVEFEATAEMTEYVCDVHPTTMRGDVDVGEGGNDEENADGGEDADDATDLDATPSFDPATVEEQQGDVAEITLSMGDVEEVAVTIGSPSVNYELSFTVVDGSGDGEVTLELDTFRAGRLPDDVAVSAIGEDSVVDAERTTPLLSSPLESGSYLLRASLQDRVVSEGLLVLEPRATTDAEAGVAPATAVPTRDGFLDAVTTGQEVAAGDWAVVAVQASGLYATLSDASAFENDALGYDLAIEQAEATNVSPDRVDLADVHVVPDPENDRFLAVVDSAGLLAGESYDATFTVTDANPYVAEGAQERVATEFAVVERTAAIDTDDGAGGPTLTVAQGETTITGTTTVAPGSTIVLSITGTGEHRFVRTARPTVADDRSWSADVDFSDVPEGATFEAHLPELSDPVTGEVTAGDE